MTKANFFEFPFRGVPTSIIYLFCLFIFLFIYVIFQSNWPSLNSNQTLQLVPQTPPLNGQSECRIGTPTKSGQTIVSPLR